jgi:beta-lactamase class A
MSYKKATFQIRVFRQYRSKGIEHGIAIRRALRMALRTTIEGAALSIVAIVVVQLAYPHSTALPQTTIGGKNYGYQSAQQIALDIAALHNQKMHITSGAKTLEFTPKELGITFTGAEDAERAIVYDWRERLVPFSLLLERREIPSYGFTVDDTKARMLAVSLKQYDKAPVDATVHLEGTQAVIVKQQDGYTYDVEHVVAAIKNLKITSEMKVALQPQVTQPHITTSMAIEVGTALRQRLQKPITVQAADQSITADPALLASWTVLTPDVQNKKLHIGYDKQKIQQWLAPFAEQVYQPGTPRTVTMLDGVVTGGANAADGRALDVATTADALIAAASANDSAVRAAILPVTQSARTVRNYTRSSQGLQAFLDHWDQANSGTWGIVLKDLDGTISAGINPNRQFTAASVYKIYVAYVVYTKIDNGEFVMEQGTNNGNTISGCLDIMIVRSDNSCAHALGDMIGWEANNGMLHAKGFGSTSLAYGGQVTTAQDATNYLMQLQNGSLLSSGNSDALLYKMGHNIYRYAIPAGSPGIHSANKLGALGAFSNDVAIVYHPKGAYVLSVFSQGSNHSRIRELAREVSAIMNQ